ncbi:MAG: type II toxin-antitoxin system RelE/ParE family toxin [Mesorhizobium sp.]
MTRRSSHAEDDLITIWLYVAQENEAAADRLLDRIEERWGQLAAFPFPGASRDDIRTGIHRIAVGEYLTFYRVGAEAVEIPRALHGRRNINRE